MRDAVPLGIFEYRKQNARYGWRASRRGEPQIRVGQRPPAGAGAGQSHRNTAEQSGKRRHHHKARICRKREAPIKKGDYVGTATFYYNGAELATVALVAAESVERSEIVQVLQQGQEVLTSTWFIVTATILLVLAAAYAILPS